MVLTVARERRPLANAEGREAGLSVTDASSSQPERGSRCQCGTLALRQRDLRALCLLVSGGERPQTQIWDRICSNPQ